MVVKELFHLNMEAGGCKRSWYAMPFSKPIHNQSRQGDSNGPWRRTCSLHCQALPHLHPPFLWQETQPRQLVCWCLALTTVLSGGLPWHTNCAAMTLLRACIYKLYPLPRNFIVTSCCNSFVKMSSGTYLFWTFCKMMVALGLFWPTVADHSIRGGGTRECINKGSCPSPIFAGWHLQKVLIRWKKLFWSATAGEAILQICGTKTAKGFVDDN